ncbi:DUF1707 SHOCT-like domain-containing protein [Mangrovihabitans endophyticus]|uniref:DUF1707 domain-containing protein n=1 Tax=Mangrovihabitans endophyticus TaxID=1751298 RepID=A0A8J3BYR4_9ACTN|nr:DUF1707 domain-containing protein [Mangrovihabitans endophyticus]GGK93201.1 hypothetical protein GCM10012284_28960 [Mangrovihabitans endophyticus]
MAGEIQSMRAADADRHKVADQLKVALDEGRLSLNEYDDRVRDAYAARTYEELLTLVADLPKPGLSAAEVNARREAERKRAARRMPTALAVLWTIWLALAAVNVVVWGLVAVTTDGHVYPWPIWLAVPGAGLLVVTGAVQGMRARQS